MFYSEYMYLNTTKFMIHILKPKLSLLYKTFVLIVLVNFPCKTVENLVVYCKCSLFTHITQKSSGAR